MPILQKTLTPLHISTLAILAALNGPARSQDVPSDQDVVRRAVHVCASCHGESGHSVQAGVPNLAAQMPQYVIEQLKDFRSQTRVEPGTRAYMWGVSALLEDSTITGLADYYAAQSPAPGKPGRPALIKIGRNIFDHGIPDRGVRACAACHGDKGEGQAAFPRLAGQHATYVYSQLKVFGGRLRPHGIVMKVETSAMKDVELRAVAEYIESL